MAKFPNLRAVLRDWLNKPTKAEIEAHQKWQAEMYALLDWTRTGCEPPSTGPDSSAPGQSPAGNPAEPSGRLH